MRSQSIHGHTLAGLLWLDHQALVPNVKRQPIQSQVRVPQFCHLWLPEPVLPLRDLH